MPEEAQIQPEDETPDEDQQIPPGLLVSVDSRGGFAVPRQLAGRVARTGR